MRIFILLSRVPYPLEKGDKLRAYHQIRELSKKNEIILCALNPDKKLNKQKAFAALQPFCRSINFIDIPFYRKVWNMLMAYFKGLPIQTGYFFNKSASRKINRLIEEYKPEHIYCQLLRTAEYVLEIKIPKTLDYQDVFSYGMKRRYAHASFFIKPFFKMEYTRLARYEEKIFNLFENKTIISVPDRELIPHPEREKIHVIPNGVDWEYFSPLNREKAFELIFIGNMAYPPNIDAAEFLAKEIMPIIWKKLPDAKLLLAGASPHLRVKSLSSEKIKVSGWLDDIRDAYSSGKIFIAPMRIGTGLQNKLLEAMAMQIPCITTPLANDALKAEEGNQILVGSSVEELADCVLKLLEDKKLYSRLAVNGQQLVKKHFSWEEYTEQLHRIINGLES
jgi:polysaccharide biosynthesis protein PslH